MNTAKVFTTGRSQAVRLPKEFRFKEGEVAIKRVGDLVLLFPRRKGWDVLVRALDGFSGDFLEDRKQPRRAERRRML
ncbi:MAG: AbrB/MazE/SpoVT family DNA-binding domain-containing protein [Planctomycetes bacterium]|nr:AbrB/MazE/SpoVT family DNA-binding domain-containing protein [Planctomycetota bacterium]